MTESSFPNALRNTGFHYLNAVDDFVPRSLVVTGIARSGTSMIAHLLEELGFFPGERADKIVVEDRRLAELIEKKGFGAPHESELAKIIERYDKAHDRWFLKRPGIFRYMPKIEHLFPDLAYIIVFRDPLAISVRNMISVNQDVIEGLDASASQIGELIAFCRRLEKPALLVSYEKAIVRPDHLIREVAAFCNIEAFDPDRIAATIQPEPSGYLESSRSTAYVGRVLARNNRVIRGWIARAGTLEPAANVELRIGDQIIDGAPAGFEQRTIGPENDRREGNYGFRIDVTQINNQLLKYCRVYGPGDVKPLRKLPAEKPDKA